MATALGDTVLRFGDFELDVARPELRLGGRVVALRPKSLAVIRHLAERPGRLVRKEELVDAVWEGIAVTDATLSRTLFEARQALGDDAKQPRFIETVHRLGFRFIGGSSSPPAESVAAVCGNGIVGRQAELERLDDLRRQADAGVRQIVFVAGEAGIGKTSVLEAFLARSKGEALVGRGQCIEHYGAGEAYLPLLDAVGELCRGVAGSTIAAVLRKVAPTWFGQFPWLIDESDRAAIERELRGVAQERMLREIAEAVETLARKHPLILALEDLHWTDSATTEVVSYLARRPGPARLMVVATYRPVDAILAENPIREVHHELLRQNRCKTLPIEPLSAPDIVTLVGDRFPRAPFAADLAAAVHRRTEGNPLFAVSLLDDLVTQGRIVAGDGEWRLGGQVHDIESSIPEDLRQMVRRQAEHLATEEHEVVAAASVAGVTFSAAEAAAALERDLVLVEETCEAMVRRGVFVERAATAEWSDGTSASSYTFRHALYRDVLYDGLGTARRRLLHRRVGERLEAAHGGTAGAAVGLLGMHFEEAGDRPRAARYLRQGAELAARRGGPREALALSERARRHLAHLPEGFERTVEELFVEIAAGPALAATQGYAAPEVERIFTRARELCRALGDGPQLFPVLWGLWAFWAVRGRINVALGLAQECLQLAEQTGDREFLLEAHHALWVTQFFRGEIGAAQRHLEAGLALYDRAQHHLHVMLFGQDPGVVGLAYQSLVLLARGRDREALEQSESAIALGREIAHPVSLIFSLHFGAWMHEQRGDAARCRELAGEVLEISTAHALPFWHAHATWFAARAAACADPGAGIAGMRAGIDSLRATGAGMGVAAYLTTLGRTRLEMGVIDEARQLADEAAALTEESGEELTRGEILRLRGDIALAENGPVAARRPAAVARAEKLFREAVDLARRQEAPGLELRAALSLARLWPKKRLTETRALLRPILDCLPADGDAPEVLEARSLTAG